MSFHQPSGDRHGGSSCHGGPVRCATAVGGRSCTLPSSHPAARPACTGALLAPSRSRHSSPSPLPRLPLLAALRSRGRCCSSKKKKRSEVDAQQSQERRGAVERNKERSTATHDPRRPRPCPAASLRRADPDSRFPSPPHQLGRLESPHGEMPPGPVPPPPVFSPLVSASSREAGGEEAAGAGGGGCGACLVLRTP